MLDEDQFDAIDNPEIKRVVQQLANLLETSLADNDELRAEVQRLRDENNRLKGEQGRPDIKPSKPAPKETSDHSSAQVINTYRYKPFGDLLSKTGTGADPAFGWVGTQDESLLKKYDATSESKFDLN